MINKVTLAGNVGKEPEIRTAKNGNKIATFSLATTESFKTKEGEWEKKTEWHKIVAFGKSADFVEKHLIKGMRIMVDGKISYSKYEDKDGSTRFSTDIILQQTYRLDKFEKKETPAGASNDDSEQYEDEMPF